MKIKKKPWHVQRAIEVVKTICFKFFMSLHLQNQGCHSVGKSQEKFKKWQKSGKNGGFWKKSGKVRKFDKI